MELKKCACCGKETLEAGISYEILPAACSSCGACAKGCPAKAISVQDKIADGKKKPFYVIDNAKCTRCSLCKNTCKFSAIDVL